ncbi:hypothetical protein [Thioalkalivibrio sp.]|uniref:hypothetical protein n=1 Tax=Thioalkalivibrio sp. TaxID=2093813 RepID=UPI00356512C6
MANTDTLEAECIGGPLDGDVYVCRLEGGAWKTGFRFGPWSGRYELDKASLEYRWTPDEYPDERRSN